MFFNQFSWSIYVLENEGADRSVFHLFFWFLMMSVHVTPHLTLESLTWECAFDKL